MPHKWTYRPHFYKDWIASSAVRQMSFTARGIYHELLDVQWEDGSIPEAERAIRAILRCSEKEWSEFAPFVDECFPVDTDGLRRNPHCHEARDERVGAAERMRQKNTENGKKGGRPPKSNAEETQTQLKPKQKPTQTQTKPKNASADTELVNDQNPGNHESETLEKPKKTQWVTERERDIELELSPSREREERRGVGEPLSPIEISLGADSDLSDEWWDNGDDLPCQFVKIIRSSKHYGKFAPTEKRVRQLIAHWQTYAPDDQVILDKALAFRDRAQAQRPREVYADPLRTLDNWCKSDEAKWRSVKRQREIDAERAARSAPPPAEPQPDQPRPGIDFEFRQMPVVDGQIVWLEDGEEPPPGAVDVMLRFVPGTNERFEETKWRAERGAA